MHALHAILMRLDGNQASRVKEALQEGAIKSVDDIEFSIRTRAMEATGKYHGGAYDSRSLNDAGAWSDKFPGWGVILGAEKPEDFKKLLQEYARFPLQQALEFASILKYEDCGWRSKKEIQEGGYIVIDNNGIYDVDNVQLFWSGHPSTPITLNEDFVKAIWDNKFSPDIMWGMETMLRLVLGEYTFYSQFYSVPDKSSKISAATMQAALENPNFFALVFSDYHH